MADVFISYSRKDREFVRTLHTHLQRAKRDVWVDWEDIPPSAEWLREIEQAIEGADTFIFILSQVRIRYPPRPADMNVHTQTNITKG